MKMMQRTIFAAYPQYDLKQRCIQSSGLQCCFSSRTEGDEYFVAGMRSWRNDLTATNHNWRSSWLERSCSGYREDFGCMI